MRSRRRLNETPPPAHASIKTRHLPSRRAVIFCDEKPEKMLFCDEEPEKMFRAAEKVVLDRLAVYVTDLSIAVACPCPDHTIQVRYSVGDDACAAFTCPTCGETDRATGVDSVDAIVQDRASEWFDGLPSKRVLPLSPQHALRLVNASFVILGHRQRFPDALSLHVNVPSLTTVFVEAQVSLDILKLSGAGTLCIHQARAGQLTTGLLDVGLRCRVNLPVRVRGAIRVRDALPSDASEHHLCVQWHEDGVKTGWRPLSKALHVCNLHEPDGFRVIRPEDATELLVGPQKADYETEREPSQTAIAPKPADTRPSARFFGTDPALKAPGAPRYESVADLDRRLKKLSDDENSAGSECSRGSGTGTDHPHGETRISCRSGFQQERPYKTARPREDGLESTFCSRCSAFGKNFCAKTHRWISCAKCNGHGFVIVRKNRLSQPMTPDEIASLLEKAEGAEGDTPLQPDVPRDSACAECERNWIRVSFVLSENALMNFIGCKHRGICLGCCRKTVARARTTGEWSCPHCRATVIDVELHPPPPRSETD